MNPFRKIARSLGFGKASKVPPRFPARSHLMFDPVSKSIDEIAKEIGDGTTSDLLTSCIRWLQRAALEAPPEHLDPEGGGIESSPVLDLLASPNEFYGFDTLVSGAVWDLSVDGNAYFYPVENANGATAELWWLPASSVEPWWPDNPSQEQVDNGDAFIQHYVYQVSGRTQKLGRDEVIHFRQGVDPQNIRKGLGAIRGLLREIWTDNESATFVASLLARGGVPGVVVSPRPAAAGEEPYSFDDGVPEAIKAKIDEGTTRTKRGSTLVVDAPVELKEFGFDPKSMDLSAIRDIPEERVTAALGIAAAVVGLGTGLQTVKVGATMREMTRQSYRNGVVPLWKILESGITQHLVEPMQAGTSVRFDRGQVEALQEDEDAKVARLDSMVKGGWATRGEARLAMGFEAGPRDDVYLMPMTVIEVPASAAPSVEVDVTPAKRLQQKHEPSLLEAQIIEEAPTRPTPPSVAKFVRGMDRVHAQAESIFVPRLVPVFDELGSAGERAALAVLGEAEERAGRGAEIKEDLPDADVDAIMALLGNALAEANEQLSLVYAKSYEDIANAVGLNLATAFGIEFALPEGAQLAILREGGLRLGLVDLATKTKDALFKALTDGREEGLAGKNLARKIRDKIAAGPWRDVATRALVIARTEGAHAANTATLESARAMDATNHMMVHDNRTGFDDETCAEINGSIVTIDQAEAMGLAHPNCTRSFTPVNALLMDEMGVSL